MKRLILFLFHVIFFLSSCSHQQEKEILAYMPYSMNALYYASDSIPESNLIQIGNLYDFYATHPALFEMNNTLLGKNDKSELLLVQQCKEEVFNKWIQDKDLEVLTFQDWAIYQISITDNNPKSIHISYYNGFVIISSAGYLVEEALLTKEGEIQNLESIFPDINEIERGEFFQDISDLYLIEKMDSREELNSILEQKIIGKINPNDTLYFDGKIIKIEKSEKSIDSTAINITSFIPKDISYAGVHHKKGINAPFFTELSMNNPINYATFYLKNELEEDDPFLVIDIGKERPELLELIGNKYGVIEDVDDYFMPIIKINMEEICKEIKGLEYVPCFTNPYVLLMDKYLIFGESLNSIDVYLEGFLLNESFQQKEIFNEFFFSENKKGICNDFHYFKRDNDDREAILFLKDNNIISFYWVERKSNEESIKKISSYINQEKIKSEIFILDNHKSEKYIVFQDESNELLFLNKNNELLYSVSLDEEIQSEIHHFKDYETDDDRYIFNTKSKIYILDSKAENLHEFPMELSSPTSNGIGLINIYNTLSTYGFVACENGNFYGYDLTKGLKPMPSWNPLINTGAIENEMVFLEGKDETHYAYVNKENKLISLDRKTESRFEPVLIEEEFGKKIQVDNAVKGKERFVFHNGKGKLKIINTKGESFFLPLNNGKVKGDFLLMNIGGTLEKEYIFLSKELITAHSYTNEGFKEVLALDNIYGVNEIFEVEINDNSSLIGGLNKSKNRIYLFKRDGTLVDGFPLEGNRAFEMFPVKNNKYLIVTSFENKITNYLLPQIAL